MIRTQISLSPEQMRRARSEARRRGVSLAELVRQALNRTLDEAPDAQVRERAKQATGGFRSGHRRTSDHHDEVLSAAVRW